MISVAFIAATLAQFSTHSAPALTRAISFTIWTAGKNETVNVCKPGNKDWLSIVLYMDAGHGVTTEQVQIPGVRSLGTLNCHKSKTVTVFIPDHIPTGHTSSIQVNTDTF